MAQVDELDIIQRNGHTELCAIRYFSLGRWSRDGFVVGTKKDVMNNEYLFR